MLAKTPPMGWNSWDCYGAAVNEEITRANALYMKDHLAEYGYEYVVVDIQWFEPTADTHDYHPFTPLIMDEYGRLLPAENRFPSAKDGKGFAPLAEFVHSLGLKFGIHILRGIPRQAVHANTPVKGTNVTARQIAATNSICRWNTDMYGVNPDAEGAQEYYNSIFGLYAAWGVDFIKVDDISFPYSKGEVELIRHAIDNCGREMVLSLSPGATQIENAEHLKQHANMWRITDDFWDIWNLLYNMFERAEVWCTHSGPGHWPDADMLPVGAIRQDYSPENWTRFTKDEQKTMMTLWCVMRSPLIIGAEMTKNDAFTLELLTNKGLLEMHRKSRGAHQVYRRVIDGVEQIVWSAIGQGDTVYVCAFNASETDAEISVNLEECGVFGDVSIVEMWSGESVKAENGRAKMAIPAHGAVALRVNG